MTETTNTIKCDNCGAEIEHHLSTLKVDRVELANQRWTEIHVSIIFREGQHNPYEDREADLCNKCRSVLLHRALNSLLERKK
jgi:DNA-directed RNA polymerase subunit M/transcription elongation factor TFIIS